MRSFFSLAKSQRTSGTPLPSHGIPVASSLNASSKKVQEPSSYCDRPSPFDSQEWMLTTRSRFETYTPSLSPSKPLRAELARMACPATRQAVSQKMELQSSARTAMASSASTVGSSFASVRETFSTSPSLTHAGTPFGKPAGQSSQPVAPSTAA